MKDTSPLSGFASGLINLDSSANIERYAFGRTARSRISGPDSISSKDRTLAVARALFEQTTYAIESGRMKLISDEMLLTRIREAHAVWERELLRCNYPKERLQPISVVIDTTLPTGHCMVRGLPRLVCVNSDLDSVPATVLAHEFGHAGAVVDYRVSNSGIDVVSAGILRQGEGRESNRMLEELASMAHFVAALQDTSELEVVEKMLSVPCSIAKEFTDQTRDMIETGLRIFYADAVTKARSVDGARWFTVVLHQLISEGVDKVRFPTSAYNFSSQNASPYSIPVRAMDLLDREVFPQQSPESAALDLRGDLVFSQAASNFCFLFKLLERAFGKASLSFFARLQDTESQLGEFSKVMLSFYASAASLPDADRIEARDQIVEVCSKYFGSAGPVVEEYDAWVEERRNGVE